MNSQPTDPEGYPDFLQEGVRVQIGVQDKDQIRLLEDPSLSENKQGTCSRHLEVVTTQVGPGLERSALLVSVSNRRFLLDPRELNEGRVLDWDLNQSVVPSGGFSADMNGQNDYIITYDLFRSYGNPPNWTFPGENWKGYSQAGWELHVPESQPDGELHFFAGGDTEEAKVDAYELFPDQNEYDKNHLLRAWYSNWPNANGTPPSHDGFRSRDRFHSLGRITLSAFPSKVDPSLIITNSNDAGVIPDGDPVLDYDALTGRGTINTPNEETGSLVIGADHPLYPEGTVQPLDPTRRLNLGVATAPGGGWTHHNGTYLWEYRLGWWPFLLGESDEPNYESPIKKDIYAIRLGVVKFRPKYNAMLEIEDIEVQPRLELTPPASKFSPLPYDDTNIGEPNTMLGHDYMEFYQNQWYGRLYYVEPETFEDYNEYVSTHYSTTDPEGIMFLTLNGSPQGVWAYGLNELRSTVDNLPPAPPMDTLRNSVVRPQAAPGNEATALGGLVTHPEYWNIPDVRYAAHAAALNQPGELFLQGIIPTPNSPNVPPKPAGGIAAVHTWDIDMGQLPNPDYVPGTDPPHLEKKWMMAAACGFIELEAGDPALDGNNGWNPDQEFIDGHHHMLVRLFDMSDPELLHGAIPAGFLRAQFQNDDSHELSADTIIGPDAGTSANFVKFIHTKDGSGSDRDLLLVSDLGGKIYLYDLAGVLAAPNSNSQSSHRAAAHYGSFFKLASDASLIYPPYEVQKSLSDDFHGAVYGVEVAQETWVDGQSISQEATYIYVGVPRVGVEVIKLGFAAQSSAPMLEYLGVIQTPGNATRLHIEKYPTGSNYPETMLFVADYNGRYRIYRNPSQLGGL